MLEAASAEWMAIISECMDSGVLTRCPPPAPAAMLEMDSKGVKVEVKVEVRGGAEERSGDEEGSEEDDDDDDDCLYFGLCFCFDDGSRSVERGAVRGSCPVLRAPPLKPLR